MPKICDSRLDSMVHFLTDHRKHSDVSLDGHSARRVADLSRMVLARRRVYLDTRYWIFLRDAALERPRKPIHREMLEALLEGVASGSLLCPIGDSTFFELLRQADPKTRLATARLIDALSLGVTIQNAPDRLQTELLRVLIGTAVDHKVPEAPIDRVWLKVGHVLGTAEPVFDGVTAEEQLAISKAFFDVMWSVTLEELLTDTPWVEEPADPEFTASAARITAASRTHAPEVKSFQELNLAEIRGFFDVHREELCHAFAQMHALMEPNAKPATADDFRRNEQVFVNVFSNIFRYGKAGTSLPTAQIVAGLHAIVRWHRQRPFRASDFYDIYHATAALPYCDIFLTERFLGTALSRPPLALGKHFSTTILWDEESSLAALRTAVQ